MSLLCSFSFSLEFTPDMCRVLTDISEEQREKYHEYMGDILDALIEGRIDLFKPFNIKAYVNTLKDNQKKAKAKRNKKVRYIFDDADYSESVSLPRGYIPMCELPATERAGETVELDIEIQEAVDEIRECNLTVAAYTGVDMIRAMIAATRFTGRTLGGAQSALRKVVTKYPKIGESIQTILSSGYQVDELFPEEVRDYNIQRNDLDSGWVLSDDYTGG